MVTKKGEREKERERRRELREREMREIERFPKLLILGPGQSGKSTFFKQLIQKYRRQEEKIFDSTDMAHYAHVVRSNILELAQGLAENSGQYGGAETKDGKEAVAYVLASNFQNATNNPPYNEQLPPDRVSMLQKPWADPGIRRTYAARSNWHRSCYDTSSFFLDKLDVIGSFDYVPTFDDVLRTRLPTSTADGKAFESISQYGGSGDARTFKVVDIGGYRVERKKWIHHFEHASAVVFVAAMHEFDEVLFEDDTTNRMTEALAMFSELVRSIFFQKHPFHIALEQNGLFAGKSNGHRVRKQAIGT
jgi:GTPase SAR1 family protein